MNVELQAAARASVGRDEVAELYRAHFGYVWQVLQKLGVEPVALEDATHDVFMVAHRRWRDFEGRSAARTWLFAVARRVAYRYRRADRRRRRRYAALALVVPPDVVEPDALLRRKRAWYQLLAFLDDLPPEHREAFVLGEIEGISRARMGRVLGISPNTAYSRLRAARRRFVESFPSPEQQVAVRRAADPPSLESKRRGWALLAAHAWPRSALLGGLIPALGAVGVVAAFAIARPWPAESPVAQTMESSGTAPTRQRERSSTADPPRSAPAQRTDTPPVVAPEVAVRRDVRASHVPPGTTPRKHEPERAAPVFDELEPAMALLGRARLALREHRTEDALTLLERSEHLDAQGAFGTERAVTRLWALCASDRIPQARAELRRLQRNGPAMAYADVLSGSCVADLISTSPRGDQGK